MPAKRIILFYISEISGHHSATLAIENAIKKIEPQAEVLNINAFNYTNPISEKVINRLYLEVIKRTPKIWDYLYDNPAVVKKLEKIKDTIHKFNSPKLKKLFDKFNPDAVICTQAFPCGMVADFKKTYPCGIKLIAVLTDYIPHAYWVYDAVDFYVCPSEEVSQRLVSRGVKPEKIKPLGIPFDLKFNEPQDKNRLMQANRLDLGLAVILVMGGGQGLGPIKKIIKSLEKTRADIQEIIVTGTNKKLYRTLKRRIKKYRRRILLAGYAQNVHQLMAVSDIIVSKPGGVTTAEVLAKNLPMVIVKPIPGQETSNTDYLTQRGAAIKIDRPEDINLIIDELLEKRQILQNMKDCQARISKPNASLDIARLTLGLSCG
jgi:processive 1,2-diacylglycerol beta-glucosyltransferase